MKSLVKGLTMESYCTIQSDVNMQLKNNACAQCGDFDYAFRTIVNTVLKHIEVDTSMLVDLLDKQENQISEMLARIDKLNLVRGDYRPLAMQRSKIIGMIEVAMLLNLDISKYKWIYNI